MLKCFTKCKFYGFVGTILFFSILHILIIVLIIKGFEMTKYYNKGLPQLFKDTLWQWKGYIH